MSGRPPTSMRNRTGTSSSRPPGTARPMTRGGQGYGSNIFGGINVADRSVENFFVLNLICYSITYLCIKKSF